MYLRILFAGAMSACVIVAPSAAAAQDPGTVGIPRTAPPQRFERWGPPIVAGHEGDLAPSGSTGRVRPVPAPGRPSAPDQPLEDLGNAELEGQVHGPLPVETYAPHCAGPNERQYFVMYVWRKKVGGWSDGNGDRYSDALPPENKPTYERIADLWRRTSNYLSFASLRQGGPVIRLRTHCSQVLKMESTTEYRYPSDVWKEVRDYFNGQGIAPWVKVFVFADFPAEPPNSYGYGVGNLRADSKTGIDNLNNKPGPGALTDTTPGHRCTDRLPNDYDPARPEDARPDYQPCGYGIIYNDWAEYDDYDLGLMHELAHTMGAVQRSAPNEHSNFHCFDGIDVMCTPERITAEEKVAGSYDDVDDYDERYCVPDDVTAFPGVSFFRIGTATLPPLDCRNWQRRSRVGHEDNTNNATDDYFYAGTAAAGPYLSRNWNIARGYHGYIIRSDGSP